MLKRSGFTKKPYNEIILAKQEKEAKNRQILTTKRSVKAPKKVVKKKVKEKSMKLLNNKLWELCRGIIIELYGNTCYTTNVINLTGSNLHLSHLIAKAALPMTYKYDLRLLRPASYHSNINLSGDTHNYLEHYLQECNITHQDWETFRKEIRTAPLVKSRDFIMEKIDYYTQISVDIKSNKLSKEDYKNKYTKYKTFI